MKCKNCDCCHKVTHLRYFPEFGLRNVDVYECWGVKEPFEINDINKECTEYPEKRDKKLESFDNKTQYLKLGTEECGLEITPEDIVFIQKGERKTWTDMLQDMGVASICPCCGRKL